MLSLILMLAAAPAPAAGKLSEAEIRSYVEPCRQSVIHALFLHDTSYLPRFMDSHGITGSARDDLFMTCAGYARGISDLGDGKIVPIDHD